MHHPGDTFIYQQLGAYLAGEPAVYTAYLETATGNGFIGVARRKAYWAALTATRLYLIEARVGAFKPLYENKGVRVIERSMIQGVHSSGNSLVIAMGVEQLQLSTARHADKVSGQALFAAELATRHGGNPVATKIASSARIKTIASIVVGIAVAGWYGYHTAYGGRAEVAVNCNPVGGEMVCKASHHAGGADARTCWDFRLTCVNGRKSQAHACVDVEHGSSAEVTLRESDFSGFAECDQVAGSELANLEVLVD